MLLTPAQIKLKSFEWRRNSFFFFTQGGSVSCLCACLGARLLPQSYQYPNLSEDADRVGGQLRGDKRVPLQWHNQIWQSLEDGAGKRCSECDFVCVWMCTHVCAHMDVYVCMCLCTCAHMAVPECIFVCIYKHTTGNITDHRGSKCQKNIHK